MNTSRLIVRLTALVLLAPAGWELAAVPVTPLTLASNGRTAYQIVTPALPSAPQAHAAAELARFLGEISGASFPVTDEQGWGGGPAIFVGLSPTVRRLAPEVRLGGLGHDGVVIQTVGEHLLLVGGEPRGTLYAVYTFLEDELGCHWWTPEASTIPKAATITIPALGYRHRPPLEYREPFFWGAFEADWAARNQCNGASARVDAKRGGNITYQGFVHTFYPLVPPEQHFASHPEWYSQINGKRVGEHAQLCLTNAELPHFVAGRVMEWLRQNPRANIVSVSQNDWGGYCTCAQCKAVDAREGSHAGSLLQFVNAVAREVGKQYPQVAIDTLAYQYTRRPPRHVRPEPNVIVRLCSIECDFSRPFSAATNRAFYRDLAGWSKVSRRLYCWDYVTNFSHYLAPYPNLGVLGPNVRTLVEHGVRGIFAEGVYETPGEEMAALKAWVLAKLFWDPTRDAGQLVAEFRQGYFGPAAPHVARYLEIMRRDAEAHGTYLGCFYNIIAPFPSYEALVAAEAALAQARQAVAGQAELERRVRLAQLPLLYLWVYRPDLQGRAGLAGYEWYPGGDAVAAARQFGVVCKEEGITYLAISRPLDAGVFLENRGRAEPPAGYGHVRGVVDLQDYSFNMYGAAPRYRYQADATASDGWVIAVEGDQTDAVETQVDLGFAGGRVPAQGYRAFAVVKCELAGDSGDAFATAFYSHRRRDDFYYRKVPASAVKAGQWQTWEIGTLSRRDLADTGHLWVGMVGNGATVKSVAVDRFFLVPAGR